LLAGGLLTGAVLPARLVDDANRSRSVDASCVHVRREGFCCPIEGLWRVSRRTLNLGILAHVDAGKTTLTERLLAAAGVIDEVGSVDEGTTVTDSLDLERQRGITIKSAVVSFSIGGVAVNLIDTPGHPDFIAEVERALSVLDGAVLVISAVEGVQPQTRILYRALCRLMVPTLMFVNKIDRRGADCDRVLGMICERLSPAIVAMSTAHGLGTRAAAVTPRPAADPGFAAGLAELLAEHSDPILAAYLDGDCGIPAARLRAELAAQTARMQVHPVFFGSALTGAGTQALMTGIAELLPASAAVPDGPVSGRVFKIERGRGGEKIGYVRMFAGSVRARDRVRIGGAGRARKVTAVSVFGDGPGDSSDPRGPGDAVSAGGAADRGGLGGCVSAGQIGKLRGLAELRIGDTIGVPPDRMAAPQFPPPTLETVVTARYPAGQGALRAALAQLAEQDPLINVRQDDIRGELWVSLYGEVQKEVIGAMLAADYGLDVTFRETSTIHVEQLTGVGAAVERLREPPNPFLATVGLRVSPAAAGTGVGFSLEVEPGAMPPAFFRAVEDTARRTLRQGLYGWEVTDCAVVMTHSGYWPRQSHAHQGFSKAMSSTGEDFRKLTPLVLMAALRQAGTVVCEPVHRFRLEAPADSLAVLLPALARLRAVPGETELSGRTAILTGDIPARCVHGLRQQLPPLSHGEGVVECAFDRYQPVRGAAPVRPRWDCNPLNRQEYLTRISRATSP
jgi:ribosomal protection tetracycline resistance protein